MSFLQIEDKNIYYEVHGESENTLLILNGIMMSSASWKPFISYLKKHVKVVLMDFYDQGKSAYLEGYGAYDQHLQVEAVEALVKALSLRNITLLGISYGGEVAMQLAISKKIELRQLVLANTTAYTTLQLKAIGDNWIHAAETLDGRKFFKATIPPIYSTGFYEKRAEWLDAREKMFADLFDEKWYEGFIRLVRSAETHDARQQLHTIDVPTLIIGADCDFITPLSCQLELLHHIPGSKMLTLQDCGHASMYEQPQSFFSAVLGFILSGNEVFHI